MGGQRVFLLIVAGNGDFGSVQECYIMRQSRTYWLPLPINTGKSRKIADGNSKKKSALMFCFLALRLLPFSSAVAAGNK
jgi:hypothetical protein